MRLSSALDTLKSPDLPGFHGFWVVVSVCGMKHWKRTTTKVCIL